MKGTPPAPSQHILGPAPHLFSAAPMGSMLLPMCKALYPLLLSATPFHTWPHPCTLCAVPHVWCCIPHTQCPGAAPRMPSTAPQTCLYPCKGVDSSGSLLSFGDTGLWDLGAQGTDPPSFIQRLLPQFPPQFTHLGQMGTPSGDRNVEWGEGKGVWSFSATALAS